MTHWYVQSDTGDGYLQPGPDGWFTWDVYNTQEYALRKMESRKKAYPGWQWRIKKVTRIEDEAP